MYSILGQEVTTLFDDIVESGRYYKVQFDGSSFCSGMYFFRLKNGKKYTDSENAFDQVMALMPSIFYIFKNFFKKNLKIF